MTSLHPREAVLLILLPALADALVRVAELAEAHRDRVRGLDINPLVVLEEGRGVIAVDWLVELT